MSSVVSKPQMLGRAEARASALLSGTSLPEGWKWLTLRSVCLQSSMVDPSRAPERTFRYVDVSAVSNQAWQIQSVAEHTGATAPSRARKQIKANDILFATIRPTLRRVAMVPAFLDGEVASTAFCVLRADPDKADPTFVYYSVLVDDFIDRVGSLQHGASYPAVSDGEVLQQEIAMPPLAEQQAIGAILAKLQKAFQTQDSIVATLKELKAATMAKLFQEGLRGEPLKQTEIGEIPENWGIVPLGDVCNIERGRFAYRPRNDPRFYGGMIPFIQTGDVAKSNGRIRTYSQTLNEAGLAISRLFPKGTIVLTIAANIADTGILEFDSAFPDSLVGITPDHSVDGEFLEYYLRTQKREMNRLAPKGTQMNINIQFLKPWPVPLPSMQEQREIARNLRCLDQVLDSASTRLEAFRSVFSTVLHDLMTGRLRVSAEGSAIVGVERFMSELIRRFEPDRVTLFGPRAPGSPRAFGDLGLLVEMPFRGLARDQAARIAREIPHDFSLDLLVRRPEELRRAREIDDRYLGGILERGRVLYVRPPSAPARQPAEREAEPKTSRRPPQALSEEALQAIVRRIVETVQPEQIVLFGSAARGEMRPDSDVDLLVVKACADRRAVAQTIRKHLADVARGLPKDIIVVTPEDVERDRDTIGYIIRPALREGRVVYAA